MPIPRVHSSWAMSASAPTFDVFAGLPALSKLATVSPPLKRLAEVAEYGCSARQRGLRIFCEAAEDSLVTCADHDQLLAANVPDAAEFHNVHCKEWAKQVQIFMSKSLPSP